jgi:hypothetical protein
MASLQGSAAASRAAPSAMPQRWTCTMHASTAFEAKDRTMKLAT